MRNKEINLASSRRTHLVTKLTLRSIYGVLFAICLIAAAPVAQAQKIKNPSGTTKDLKARPPLYITAIVGNKVTARDAAGMTIQFNKPPSQLNVDQLIWLKNAKAMGAVFPVVGSEKTKVGQGDWMETSIKLSNNGRLDGKTKTWTTACQDGFTGGVRVFPMDKSGYPQNKRNLIDPLNTTQFASLVPARLAPDANSAMTTFNVVKHGFHFVNGFTGDILIDVPVIGRVNLGRTSYGLCGGMSFAAYDNYLRDAAAPPDTAPFASGTKNRSYIYNRQDDSFRYDNAFMIRRFIEWMPLPIRTTLGVTGLQVRSHRQFKRRIKPALEAGVPVVLGILKADINDVAQRGKKNALFINHQVLAIGFEAHAIPGEDEWDIHIYDPNFPGQIQTLHTGQRIQTKRGGSHKTGGFRGFFVIPYNSKRPPWVPANLQQRNAQMIQALEDDDAPETEEERKELRLGPRIPARRP